jgi:hypothetical protein
MTDRELLEAAAKAAGMKVTGWNTQQGEEVAVIEDGSFWQPLHMNRITNADGDAFRLAVKLGIAVYPPEKPGDIATCNGPWPESPWVYEDVSGDPYAATRRAIVRAAAAIGEKVP